MTDIVHVELQCDVQLGRNLGCRCDVLDRLHFASDGVHHEVWTIDRCDKKDRHVFAISVVIEGDNAPVSILAEVLVHAVDGSFAGFDIYGEAGDSFEGFDVLN